MPKMNTGSFPQEPVLLEDRYPATLKECTEYEKDYGEGPVEKIAWIFDVTASEDAIDPDVKYESSVSDSYEVAAHTSKATGKNSTFARLNLGAWAGEGWDGDTDSLIGKEALVDVTSYQTVGGQTRNVIEKVRPAKKVKGAPTGKSKKAEITIDESDFEDIPL